MSDELFVKYNEFMKKGYINYDAERFLAFLKEQGLEQGSDEYNKEMELYTSVAMERVLKTLLPELSSYDLSHEGTDIKTLYAVRKRELDQNNSEVKKEAKPVLVEQAAIQTASIVAPVAQETAPITPNSQSTNQNVAMTEAVEQPKQEFVDDIKKIQEKIAETQKIMVQEPAQEQTIVPDKVVTNEKGNNTLIYTNPDLKNKKVNEIGYANIVLMSIIVMIIVAIVCVFIFM